MILEKILAALERLNTNLEAGATAEPKKTRAQKALESVPSMPAAASPAATPASSDAAPPNAQTTSQAPAPAQQTPVPSAPAGDMKDLSPLITQLAKTRRDDAVAILKSFGAANARELKPEHISPAIEKFKAALTAPAATGSDLV